MTDDLVVQLVDVIDRRLWELASLLGPDLYTPELVDRCDSTARRLAAAVGARAAARARGYTWPTAAARLRRVYADLTQRAPVPCH